MLRLVPLNPRVLGVGLRAFRAGLKQATCAESGRYVLGCGSNVVDHVYNVKVVPKVGEKGFFRSNFKALEKKLIGGVTLNHLCWAALGGVSSGLLALQGRDEMGQFICSGLKKMGVSTRFIKVDDNYSTAQCHVFIQEGGERSILMAPAATSLINEQIVKDHFEKPIQQYASMVTTEISQVPIAGVLEVLRAARRAGVLSVLDLDVPPSVAVEEAKLGSMEEILECVRMADILKPAKAAAKDVLQHMAPAAQNKSLSELAPALVELCGSKLVAVTDGAAGSIIATADNVVAVEAPGVVVVVDTTGAGDAFLGGLICGISNNGLPKTKEDIEALGRMANAFGATCVQSIGGVPADTSRELLQSYLPHMKFGSEVTSSTPRNKEWKRSLHRDAQAATDLVENSSAMHTQWEAALDVIDECGGQILTSGIGKSGLVAERLAASLSSIGVAAQYVHASEWSHGDLGKAQPGRDVCVFLSHSGQTSECLTAASQLAERGVAIVAVTGTPESDLARLSTSHLSYSSVCVEEPFGCLPSSSIIAQEMVCNALVCELLTRRGVEKEDFKKNHPGGNIGVQLSRA